jgi:hypothetical protein
VAAVPPTVDELAALAAAATRVLGPGITFDTELVPELAPGPRGKFRVYRSYVASAHDSAADPDPAAAAAGAPGGPASLHPAC